MQPLMVPAASPELAELELGFYKKTLSLDLEPPMMEH